MQVAIRFSTAERFSVPITTRSATEEAEGPESHVNVLKPPAHARSGRVFTCSQFPAYPVTVAHPEIDFEINHG